jgi:hypothetical protein
MAMRDQFRRITIFLWKNWSRRSGLNGRPADYEIANIIRIASISNDFEGRGCSRMRIAARRRIPGASELGR